MEKTSEKALSSKQLIAVVAIIGLGLNMLNLPALAVMQAGKDGYIAMLVMVAADCAALWLTLWTTENLRKVEWGRRVTAVLRVAAGVIGGAWSIAKLVLIVGEARLFYGETVFENLGKTAFSIFVCALIAVLGSGGKRAVGRLAELAVPITAVTAAILVFTSFVGDMDLTDVLPVLEGKEKVLFAPVKLALWTGNFPVLFCFCGDVEQGEYVKTKAVCTAATCGAAVVLLTFVLGAIYGSVTHLVFYGSNASSMNQYIGSYNFGRIDLIVFVLWSVALFIEAGVYSLSLVRSLSFLTKRDRPRLYSFIGAATVYAILDFVLTSKNSLLIFATEYAALPAAVIEFLLPPLVAVAVWITKKKKDEKKENDA